MLVKEIFIFSLLYHTFNLRSNFEGDDNQGMNNKRGEKNLCISKRSEYNKIIRSTRNARCELNAKSWQVIRCNISDTQIHPILRNFEISIRFVFIIANYECDCIGGVKHDKKKTVTSLSRMT